MKVIICGAGQVGSSIARHLAGEKNDVTVIDRSPELIEKIGAALDVQGIVGYASHPSILEQAGAENADLLIAATLSDEVNMVACQVAHSLFKVPTKIARIRTQDYIKPHWRQLFSTDQLPIDVIISPEEEVAKAAYRRLEVAGAFETVAFADGRVELMGIHIHEDCPIADTPLRQLTELFPDLDIRVVGIQRGEKTIVPRGEDQILFGDDVYVICAHEHIGRTLTAFGQEQGEARRVIIIGGGNVGLTLARMLERSASNVTVKIIEESIDRAEMIADLLDHSVVLHGDALDSEILREANVAQSDAVVAVTNDDEVNILSSLLAKREGIKRAVTLVTNSAYRPIMGSLGVDVFIDPRATTVSTILQHVRRGRIRGIVRLANADAEVIEAEAMETSSLVGKTLRELDLPKGLLIGALVRDDEVILPGGDTEIKARDTVILFAQSSTVRKVEQLFSVQLEFF